MGSAVEIHRNLGWSDLDGGGEVEQVTEDLSCLGIGVAPHAVGEAAIESACHHEECEIKIHLERDCRGECIHVEETDSVREGVFDQHPLRIAGDEPLDAFCPLVGQKDCGILVAKVLDKDLP